MDSNYIIVRFFYPINTYLYLQAVKYGQLSKVLPIQSLQPAVNMLTGALLLSEVLPLVSIIAVLTITLGIYILNIKNRKLYNPLRPFLDEKSSLYMLLSVLVVSLAAVIDKSIIKESNALYYCLVSSAGGCLSLYISARIMKEPEIKLSKRKLINILQISNIGAISSTAYLIALSVGPIALVSAIRGTSIVMASLFGIFKLNEPLTRAKLLAFFIIMLGSVILVMTK